MCRWVSPHGTTPRPPKCVSTLSKKPKDQAGTCLSPPEADTEVTLMQFSADRDQLSTEGQRDNESPTRCGAIAAGPWVKNFRKYANRPTAICTYKCYVHFIDLSRDTLGPTRAVHKSKRYAPHCRPLATCNPLVFFLLCYTQQNTKY